MVQQPVHVFPILVVEDDAETREAMQSLLELNGYTVTTAVDGREALERLRGGLKPSLILLDLMMPGMDGFEFVNEKRQDPQLSPIPVIIYSGHRDARSDAARLAAEGYFQKSVAVECLLDLVEKYGSRPPIPQ